MQNKQHLLRKGCTVKCTVIKKTQGVNVYNSLGFKSGREDSNFRPLAPHASTLANCATPRNISYGKSIKNSSFQTRFFLSSIVQEYIFTKKLFPYIHIATYKYYFCQVKTNPMKKVYTILAISLLLIVITTCKKKDSSQDTTGTFAIDAFTNPTDPVLCRVTNEDGSVVTYTGKRDAAGMPQSVDNVVVNFADADGDFIINLDSNSVPSRQLTPNGTVFEYHWSDSTLRITAISPSGQVQVNVPLSIHKTLKSEPAPEGDPENIRKDIQSHLNFRPFPPSGRGGPAKPTTDNAMIFHVTKCGTDVTNAIVTLNVSPALGVKSFPCANIGNGFYSTNIPHSGEPPVGYEQECDKAGSVVSNVCSTYSLASLVSTDLSSLCPLISDEIGKAFGTNPEGDKIKAMCSHGIRALDAICKFAEKNDIAELCKLARLLNSQPSGGYSFFVTATLPGVPAYTSGSQGFDPDNPQTYMVDMGGSFDISNLMTNPFDPGPSQAYVASADIICPDAGGTSVTISVQGSDGYSNSFNQSYTSNGTITLTVPGGATSVRDVVTVSGNGVSKQISIVF